MAAAARVSLRRAAEGDFEAEIAELADMVGDLAADVAAALWLPVSVEQQVTAERAAPALSAEQSRGGATGHPAWPGDRCQACGGSRAGPAFLPA